MFNFAYIIELFSPILQAVFVASIVVFEGLFIAFDFNDTIEFAFIVNFTIWKPNLNDDITLTFI